MSTKTNGAPDFLISITVASILERYLNSSLALETIAYKYSEFLSDTYDAVNPEMLYETAEMFLHTMADAQIGEQSELYLIDYQYDKFINKPNGKSRNWKPLIGDPLGGIKKIDYSNASINRDFKAFVYRTKQAGNFVSDSYWSLRQQTDSSFLMELCSIEITPFDIMSIKT
jgi:hypothetical protein